MQIEGEGSTDGHRWQEFGVLPNAWKKPTYFHPVARTFGTGPACLLVIDADDQLGDERVWVGVSDTIGATPQRWWGAHNGWHAVGNGDVDNAADNRRGSDGAPGFVTEHLGQAGSGAAWDLYQIKGLEQRRYHHGRHDRQETASAAPGSSLRRQVLAPGPTPEMLTPNTMMVFLGRPHPHPRPHKHQNDADQALMDSARTRLARAFWAIKDGFAQHLQQQINVISAELPGRRPLDELHLVRQHRRPGLLRLLPGGRTRATAIQRAQSPVDQRRFTCGRLLRRHHERRRAAPNGGRPARARMATSPYSTRSSWTSSTSRIRRREPVERSGLQSLPTCGPLCGSRRSCADTRLDRASDLVRSQQPFARRDAHLDWRFDRVEVKI
jgi:hypothetical protein